MKNLLKRNMKLSTRNSNALLAFGGTLLLLGPVTARAMHITEGYLPVQWAIFWWIALMPFLFIGLARVKKLMVDNLNTKLLLAVVAAFAFCLSALKIPSVVGSCSHPTGVGLGTILFGPLPMVVVGVVVLLLQALLLAHGGLTTLGANGFSMAVVGPLVTFGLFALLNKMKVNKKVCIFVAASLGDLMTYLTTSIQLGFAFPGHEGVVVEITKYIGIFVVTQLPIAIGEGMLTVLVYNLVSEFLTDSAEVNKEVLEHEY